MTTDQPNDADQTPARGWVWWCNDASIAAGQVSVLAMVEIVAAVGLYWWLALHFNWPWMAFVGMIAAPMLLLRSDKSIALGLGWLGVYAKRTDESITRFEKGLIVVVTALLTGLVCYWLAKYWLLGYAGWALFFRATLIGVLAVAIGFAVAVAVALAVTFVGSVAGAVVVAVAVAGAVLGAVAVAGAVAGVALLLLCAQFKPTKILLTSTISSFLAAGMLTRTLAIRLGATLRHPLAGLNQLPQNWHETLLVLDLTHLPELLPQASTVIEKYGLKGLWRGFNADDAEGKLIAIILTPFWYIPALAYRWSLKASFWLWFPLVLALTPPLYQKTPKATRKLLAQIPAWHWLYIAVASLVMLWMFSAVPFLTQWLPLLPNEFTSVVPHLPAPPPLGVRTGLACLAALLTIILVYRTKNFKASHGKVLESPNEFRQLDDEDRAEFLQDAKPIDRIRLALIGTVLLWGEAMAFGIMHQLYPTLLTRFIWPWLLAVL